MKIIIVGAGTVGAAICQQLANEGHDITMVDKENSALYDISDKNDVFAVDGNGADVAVLEKAGADRADLLIAVTSSDELNILCCAAARKLGTHHTIARVRNPEYSGLVKLMKDEMEISLTINPEYAVAKEISRILRFPSAMKIDSFCRGRVELAEIEVVLANRSRPETLAMLILAGACLGFLRFNFHPARIFLGDTGSTFIGIIFAVIGISAMDRVVTFASLAIPVLAVGVPLFDVVLAVWRRSFRKLIDPEAGVSVMSADQDHLHHRLLRTEEYDQSRTAIRMYVICGVFSGLAMILLLLRNSVPGIAYIIVLMVILLVVRKFATIELSDSARLIQQGVSRIRPGTFFGIFHPMLDGVLIFFSYVLVSYMTLGSVRLTVFVYMAAPILLIMWLGGIYKIYWLRCSIRSFFRLLITGFFAALIGQIVMYVLIHSGMYPEMFLSDRQFVIAAALFTLLMLGLILFERMCLYYATIFLFQQLHLENQVKGQIRPIAILLYGGGLHCRMYIKALYALSRDVQGERRRIVGILDDTKLLQGLFVCDFPVLGGVDDLDAILTRCHVDRVVVTTRIKPERLKKLRDVCAAHQVAIHKFEVLDTPLEDAAPVA